jgi:outer membrane protein OmpA-like peptidoglycan-associated protein
MLSERRARKICGYFLSSGVAANGMKTIGYGETRPSLSNLTAEDRAINRRVAIKLAE